MTDARFCLSYLAAKVIFRTRIPTNPVHGGCRTQVPCKHTSNEVRDLTPHRISVGSGAAEAPALSDRFSKRCFSNAHYWPIGYHIPPLHKRGEMGDWPQRDISQHQLPNDGGAGLDTILYVEQRPLGRGQKLYHGFCASVSNKMCF